MAHTFRMLTVIIVVGYIIVHFASGGLLKSLKAGLKGRPGPRAKSVSYPKGNNLTCNYCQPCRENLSKRSYFEVGCDYCMKRVIRNIVPGPAGALNNRSVFRGCIRTSDISIPTHAKITYRKKRNICYKEKPQNEGHMEFETCICDKNLCNLAPKVDDNGNMWRIYVVSLTLFLFRSIYDYGWKL